MERVPPVGIDFFNFRITESFTPQQIEEVAEKLADRLPFSREVIIESIYAELKAKRASPPE